MRHPLALTLLAALAAAPPASAQTAAEVEEAIVKAANAFRAKHEKKKLRAEATLTRIAQAHARAMAKRNLYGDDDKNGHVLGGKGPVDRARAAGYKYAKLLENVGWNTGFKDPAAKMMADWIASPGHERNLLDPDVTETGVGAAQGSEGRWFFVQMFARPLAQAARVDVTIENRTRHTIAFTIGGKGYRLEPGGSGEFRASRPSGKVEYRISWPDADGPAAVEKGALEDKGAYAFVETKKGFAFKKVGKGK